MAIAADRVHYAHDLLTANDWGKEMADHMELHDHHHDTFSCDLVECKDYLMLLQQSVNVPEDTAFSLFNIAQKMIGNLLVTVDRFSNTAPVKIAA